MKLPFSSTAVLLPLFALYATQVAMVDHPKFQLLGSLGPPVFEPNLFIRKEKHIFAALRVSHSSCTFDFDIQNIAKFDCGFNHCCISVSTADISTS